MASETVTLATRWIARGWSILSIIYVLIVAAGESLKNQGPRPTGQEWVGLMLFPLGVCIGLALAWFREGLGGITALASLVAFYAWTIYQSGSLPHSPFFLWIGAPSVIFIAAWLQACR